MATSPTDQAIRFKKLYELSMELAGDPMDIFAKAVKIIAEMMDVKVVCLSEIRGHDLFFLCVYVQGVIQLNAGDCPLDITPCATVEASRDVRVYHNVMAHFPQAEFLKSHNAYSYCGFPSLDNHGQVVAVTCLIDDNRREFSVEDQELLRIFGQRIAHEIERKRLGEEHQAAVAKLASSEQRFREIAKAAGEFAWEVDGSGTLTYLSESAIARFGYTKDDLLGQLAEILLFPEDVTNLRQYLGHRRPQLPAYYGVEVHIRANAGMAFWVMTSVSQIDGPQGQLIGYRGAAIDITPYKKMKEGLEQERTLLRRTLDGLYVFVALTDSTGKIIEANSATFTQAGIRREDYIGIQFGDSRAWSFDSAVHARVKSAVRRAQQGETVRFDSPLLMAKGIIIIDFSIAPLFDEEGRVTQMVALGVDISKRKKTEDALRYSEEKLEMAMQGAELGLWEWDIPTGTVAFSKRWSNILGYPGEEKLSCYEAWEALIHPEDLPTTLVALNTHLDGDTPFFEAEYRAISKNTEWKWILGRGKVVARDADGQALRVIGIDMDITARKDLELRLHQRQEQLYYAQRLTSAGELAAMVSHELNQPLGSINNYIGGALLRFQELLAANPALNEVLEQTLRLSQRAIAVVHGIRALVRKQKGTREFVSLRETVDDLVAPLRTDLGNRQVRINVDIPPTLPRIWCERIHLQQLMLNLIMNAVQAMEKTEPTQRKLSLEAKLNANRKLEIIITDTGQGIAPEIATRLFEPFVTTKPEGIGLGLAISRTIAEALGGRISVRSMVGLGTTFEVILPLGGEES